MKLFNITLFSMFLLLFMSCGSSVSTEKPTDKDLSTYDSFAYLPNANPEGAGESYNDENINRYIIEAINNNLEEAGYSLDRENPDLLVLVSTRTNTETEQTTGRRYAAYPYRTRAADISPSYGDYYYSGYRSVGNVTGYDTQTNQYEEGTVVINLIDRETRETVWKGVASDRIYDQTTSEAIGGLVNDIFEEYPLND